MDFYIHIGLGKSGSTFLQQNLFKEICKISDLELYVHSLKKKPDEKNFLYSHENLIGEFFDHKTFEQAASDNLENFGKQAKIIIIIRRPIDYFSSYFAQSYHGYKIISEKKFFKTEEEIKNFPPIDTYYARYEKFNYQNLIKLYTDKFDNVYIIKYEDLKNLKMWSKIFNNKIIINIKFIDLYLNRSFSLYSIKLTYFFEKILSIFGTNLFNIQKKVRRLNHIKFLPSIIKNRLVYELRWRFFIQNRFDKIIPYKKYIIQDKKIKNLLKNKHDSFYDEYCSSFYKNGKKFVL
ncbi:hypothetical protein N9341_01820 [Candidatus Pelagibacter sp.]|nr:hypothetical protein [Candidatus Pelagibacter sp.]